MADIENDKERGEICEREMQNSVTRKKLPNVCKSCPKMISLEKLKILTLLKKCLRMWAICTN